MKTVFTIGSVLLALAACSTPEKSAPQNIIGGGKFISSNVFAGTFSSEVTDAELNQNTAPAACAMKKLSVENVAIQRDAQGNAHFRITCK